jgi:hypothetical protein
MNRPKSQSPFTSLPKFASRVALALTFSLTSLSGFASTQAANEQSTFAASNLPELANPTDLLAQATGNSILYFYTPNHVVNVFRRGNEVLMNVFDSRNNVTRLKEANAANTVLNSQPSYISFGSYSGNQATYVVSITGDRQARLIIQNANGQRIVDEAANRFDAFNPPPDLGVGGGTQDGTILRFDTPTYAVRVFEESNIRKMNVHNRLTNTTEVNGAAATLVEPMEPFQNAVSYVASGNNVGQPLQYYARLTRNGGLLQIQNINSQIVKEERSTGAITVNIPADELPPDFVGSPSIDDAWVAAVFGDERTLTDVKRYYPDAFFDSARQGRFINVGVFESRGDASRRVDDLRDRGFNSRVIYRNVTYR